MTENTTTPPATLESVTEAVSASLTNNETQKQRYTFSNPYVNEIGIFSTFFLQGILYPLERIKILQQVDISQEVLTESNKFTLRGTIRDYFYTLSENKIMESAFRGFGMKLTKYISAESLVYLLSSRIHSAINTFKYEEDPFKYTVNNFVSGAISGALIETILYPVEVAKTRMICDQTDFHNRLYPNMQKTLFSESGIYAPTTVFHGALFSLTGAAIYRGLQIGLYETLLAMGLKDANMNFQVPACVLITMLAQKVAYPFDTLRRHLMLRNTLFEPMSANFDDLYKQAFARPRSADLMKGWNMQFYKSISTGVFLAVYTQLFKTRNDRPDFISKFSH